MNRCTSVFAFRLMFKIFLRKLMTDLSVPFVFYSNFDWVVFLLIPEFVSFYVHFKLIVHGIFWSLQMLFLSFFFPKEYILCVCMSAWYFYVLLKKKYIRWDFLNTTVMYKSHLMIVFFCKST